MLKAALTSVTFRALPPERVAALAASAGMQGIEWGGDIHVPHGDIRAAARARALTEGEGLAASAYGSYFRVGANGDAAAAFGGVLACAEELGAPVVRVWAGSEPSARMDARRRADCCRELSTLVEMAAARGMRVATEYHANTLTDTLGTTLAMLRAVPGLRTLWQPPIGMAVDENLRALEALEGRVDNLHVFNWSPQGERLPLRDGSAAWRRYLGIAARREGERYATIEFVREDEEAAFLEDAEALRGWIAEANAGA